MLPCRNLHAARAFANDKPISQDSAAKVQHVVQVSDEAGTGPSSPSGLKAIIVSKSTMQLTVNSLPFIVVVLLRHLSVLCPCVIRLPARKT